MLYDLSPSREYCERIGLVWLGDDYLAPAMKEAFELGFTQAKFDAAMRHSMDHVKRLFTPSNYTWRQRLMLAAHFLFGR